jgi:transposase
MSKRRYHAVQVKQIDAGAVRAGLGSGRAVVGIDVAKEKFFAAVMDEQQRVVVTVKWKHPDESPAFVGWVSQLAEGGAVDAAMEPSGTYGDALRVSLLAKTLPVYRVNAKRSHDAAEVYDGVPSLHDAKSAAIVAKLHLDGTSEPWPSRGDHERQLSAALRVLEVHEKEFQRNCNRLEGLLARHWPELTRHLELRSATLLELLVAYGGPAAVAAKAKEARALMRRVGGRFLAVEKVDQVLASAQGTFGVEQIDEERRMLQVIAAEARRAQTLSAKANRRVEQLSSSSGGSQHMAPVIGKTTAAVLVAAVGEPRNYESAEAYVKSIGLNLKEISSGTKQGGLHITKRGPGVARLFLYLAALRLIQRDQVVSAWYARKVKRQGGVAKSKAVVAIMRKLVLALWHVAGGSVFDSSRLFDTKRLGLTLHSASSLETGH